MSNAFDQLVEAASGERLSTVLPKVLTMAQSIGDRELARWVRLELLGYVATNPAMGDDVVVPEYRTVGGHWFDVHNRPLVIDDPQLAFVNETRVREGVGELESFVGKQGLIALQLPDLSELLARELRVNVTVFRFPTTSVDQVIANIRAQVVDRLMNRRGAFEAVSETRSNSPVPAGDVWHLKPTFYGVGIDLRAAWRWIKSKRRR